MRWEEGIVRLANFAFTFMGRSIERQEKTAGATLNQTEDAEEKSCDRRNDGRFTNREDSVLPIVGL